MISPENRHELFVFVMWNTLRQQHKFKIENWKSALRVFIILYLIVGVYFVLCPTFKHKYIQHTVPRISCSLTHKHTRQHKHGVPSWIRDRDNDVDDMKGNIIPDCGEGNPSWPLHPQQMRLWGIFVAQVIRQILQMRDVSHDLAGQSPWRLRSSSWHHSGDMMSLV